MTATQATSFDASKLHTIYSDATAKGVLDQLSKRARNAKETTVDQLVNSTGNDRSSVISVFMRLQDAGAGQFIVGRRGGVSRFEWASSMIDTVKAAKDAAGIVGELAAKNDTQNEKSEPDQGKPEKEADKLSKKRGRPFGSKNKNKALRHHFILRPDFTVGFTLPENLSTDEARKLGDYVQLLAQG